MATLDRLVKDHGTVLLDVMGVLINRNGAIAGAPQFIDHLNRTNTSYFILTNVCGDTEQGVYDRLQRSGISLQSPDQVISAGSLVRTYIHETIPAGDTIAFIGPQSCRAVLETGRHRIVPCSEGEPFDVLALLDDEGFAFRETLEAALTACARRFKFTGRLPLFLLANTDSAYPLPGDSYAFGSGIFATMLTVALKNLLGTEPEVISFGKPSPRIFSEARRRSGATSLIMIGDQLATDIAGANLSGITSTLVLTGLNSRQDIGQVGPVPSHVIDNLWI